MIRNHELQSTEIKQAPKGEIAIYSPDAYSQQRIRALEAALTAIREEIPLVVGCALFGSLSKGKELDDHTAPLSDVDALLVLDSDLLDGELPRLREDAGVMAYARGLAKQQWREPTDEDIRQAFSKIAAEEFRASWQAQFKEENAPYLECGTQLLSLKPNSPDALHSIVNNPDTVDERIGMLFGCDIDGGLKPYRREYSKYLKEGLELVGMTAQETKLSWEHIRRTLTAWLDGGVKKGGIPEDNFEQLRGTIPTTAEDAAKRYR